MKRSALFLGIFILISPPLWAEEITLTLDEALAFALRDNRGILLKIEDVKKVKEKIAESKAGLLPTLNFTGSWTDTRGYYTRDLAQTTTQTTLKQYLYKGGEIINTIKYNHDKLEVAQAILDKTKLELVLEVTKSFYALLLGGEFAQLNREILENAQEHLNSLRLRYKNGEVSESDILSIQSSLAATEDAYSASLNQVETGSALLRNLLYLGDDVQIKLAGAFNNDEREIAFDEAFLKAIRKRPEIKQYEAQENADKKSIEIARAGNRPDIYASWDYYGRSHSITTTVNTRNWNDYNVLGLTFSWPIFDGWLTKAKIEQAIVDLKATQLTKGKTVRDIALELKNAYLELKNAIARIKTVQTEAGFYKNTLLTVQEKYKAGQSSALDLSDAGLKYAVSLFNQKQAVYDYIIAKAKFDKATGGI
jgi:outer membrane protein TolC